MSTGKVDPSLQKIVTEINSKNLTAEACTIIIAGLRVLT